MKTYQVLEPIKHNGKKYMPPCEIDLNDNDAQTLIDCEAIVEVSEEEAAKAEAENLAAEEAAKTKKPKAE